MNSVKQRKHLPKETSIFSTEMYAIELALDHISKNNKSKHIMFSILLSAITAFKNKKLNKLLIAKLLINLNQLNKKEIVLCRIPSHIGIKQNEIVDSVAKEAQNDAIDTNFKICVYSIIYLY